MNVEDILAGRYRLEQCIGNGGFGEVWRAFDTVTCDEVAVKIHLRENDERAAREIVKEYSRMRDIHHDNLLTPTYVGIADGHTPYLVMELCKCDLSGIDLEEADVWRLIRDVASGLKRLADNKRPKRRPDGTEVLLPDPIIHQDIKPANILLRSNGMYAISDFGISKRRLSTLSTNVQGGSEEMDSGMTVDYAAPERFPREKGVAVLASDIWSLGAMLYELVEGHRPFAECGGDCLNPTIGLPIPAITREGYSDELKQLVYDCMAREPERRPTASQLKEYAEHVMKGETRRRQWLGVSQPGGEKVPPPPKPTPKPWKKWLYASVAVVVVVLVALWVGGRMTDDYPVYIDTLPDEKPLNVVAEGVADTIEETEIPPAAVEMVEENQPPKQEKREKAPSTEETTTSKEHMKKQQELVTATSRGVRLDGNTLRFEVDGAEYSYRMVYVSGGVYMMGAPESDDEASGREKPQHSVTVGSFHIGETEVTQALWKAVMGNEPTYNGGWTNEYGRGNNYPAYRVSYDDVQEFIRELNNLTGMSFRLPTEEEWEYAARGGSNSRGYRYSGGDDIGSVAWYDGNSGGKTHPVRQKRANELGLYDMSGNVWEWCSSLWCSDYNSGRSGSNRVFRGGRWNNNARGCCVSCRGYSGPSYLTAGLGFRLVR